MENKSAFKGVPPSPPPFPFRTVSTAPTAPLPAFAPPPTILAGDAARRRGVVAAGTRVAVGGGVGVKVGVVGRVEAGGRGEAAVRAPAKFAT